MSNPASSDDLSLKEFAGYYKTADAGYVLED
jgi:hypothetical protein